MLGNWHDAGLSASTTVEQLLASSAINEETYSRLKKCESFIPPTKNFFRDYKYKNVKAFKHYYDDFNASLKTLEYSGSISDAIPKVLQSSI